MTVHAASEYVTLVELMERTAPYEEAVALLQRAMGRLEREGIQALVAIHFYADPNTTEIGSILTFSDYRQMINHITLVKDWDEFKGLFQVGKPIEVRIYGPIPPDVEAWLQRVITVRQKFVHHVAGFVR